MNVFLACEYPTSPRKTLPHTAWCGYLAQRRLLPHWNYTENSLLAVLRAILVGVISDGRSFADQAHSNAGSSDLPPMLELLRSRFQEFLTRHPRLPDLVEIVLDLGRIPEIRFFETTEEFENGEVTQEEIDHSVDRVGDFGGDNRAGIERTLHRISAIRNRRGHTEPVELAPQNAMIRRQQHLLVQRHGLDSESRGKAPNRRVVVLPNTFESLEVDARN